MHLDQENSPESYYVSLGDGRYQSTIHAQGAWNEHEQHMAPVSGILVRELERFQPRPDMRMARISFDILGLIPGGEFTIEVKMLRPGRTIELLQAELIADSRPAVRATAWRLATSDTSEVAGTFDAPMPALEDNFPANTSNTWPGGYIRSVDVRLNRDWAQGRGKVWIKSMYPLVAGEETSSLEKLIGVTDTANGIAPRVDPSKNEYMFPNTDLGIHLYRAPEGEWLGLDTSANFGTDGIGLTSTILHDQHGPFGRAEQILTVRRLKA